MGKYESRELGKFSMYHGLGYGLGVRIWLHARECSVLCCIQTGTGAHLASYPGGTKALSLGENGRNVKLTTLLHLVSRLIREELHLLSLSRLHGVVNN
jgi:hypothetical protein